MATTRKDVEQAVQLLAGYIDTDALTGRYGPGKLAIDYYNPGDNPHAYRIIWIAEDRGREYEPFGSGRMTGRELIEAIHFLRNAYYSGAIKGRDE